jgi:hypothetical protein
MNNLLVRLSRYASYQEENFLTEVFAYLLEYLVVNDPRVGQSLLQRITNDVFDLSAYSPGQVMVSSQDHIEQGITDVKISSPDFVIIFENKVEAQLGARQLERYAEWLSAQSGRRYLLILLTKYVHGGSDDSSSQINLRWIHLSNFLLEEMAQPGIDPTSKYLVSEVYGFLRAKGLSVTGARSSLSKAVSEYRLRNAEVKSVGSLKKNPELAELHTILFMMRTALHSVRPGTKTRFATGQTSRRGAPWLGWNLDSSDCFFGIYVDDPDTLVFETFRHKIRVDQLRRGSMGQIFRSYGAERWEAALDLARDEGVLYTKSPVAQLETMEEFISRCYSCIGGKSE